MGTVRHATTGTTEYFADPDRAHDFMVAIRWPNGVTCPECGSQNVLYLANQRRWKCREKHARPQFSAKVGTISRTPPPVQVLDAGRLDDRQLQERDQSSEIARALGVTQKTGWFMLHRIRRAVPATDGGKLGGDVEVDETYVGGKARNMHPSKRAKLRGRTWFGKVAVMGLLQRHPEKGKSKVRT